ncbi:hypothetical protein H8S95_15475, partial [Pontibacter sp. KCTC 32443]
MKQMNGKLLAICAVALFFFGCEKEDDLLVDQNKNQTGETCDMITFEGQTGYLDQVVSEGGMVLNVAGIARDANDEPVDDNRAMIFDSENPTGDDDDLATADWGNVLITQQLGDEGAPNDNQWGSELRFTFPERVTLKSMRVLDIDDFEHDSWAFLYVAGQEEPIRIYLEPHGDNVGFTVDLLNTANVVKLVIWFDGDGAFGSGAIDDIS